MQNAPRVASVALSDDGRTATVTPGPPRPERSPQGVPMVSLLGSDTSASLQIGVQWWPEPAELTGLIAAAATARDVPAGGVQARGDSLRNVRSDVLLRHGGEVEVVASAESSGVPPFTTVLSAQLTGDAIEATRRALFGQPDALRVRCSGDHRTAGRITAESDVSVWTKAAPQTHVVMLATER